MAISINVRVKLENGIEFIVNDAYCRVEKVTVTKNNAVAEVHYFKTKDSKKAIEIWQHGFVPNLDGENFIKQAYNHIKTLEEYANAVDC
jgi:hypothetical protein